MPAWGAWWLSGGTGAGNYKKDSPAWNASPEKVRREFRARAGELGGCCMEWDSFK